MSRYIRCEAPFWPGVKGLLVDMVEIEPTTSSMLWKVQSDDLLKTKDL